MSKYKKTPPKCPKCGKELKWPPWTGQKSIPVEKDGSKHTCDSEMKPIKQELEEEPFDDDSDIDYDDPLEELPKSKQKIKGLFIEDIPTREQAVEKVKPAEFPGIPPLRIEKIIVERVQSITYGVAKQFSEEKETVFDSLKIGFEAVVDCPLGTQAETLTHNLINHANYTIQEEFTKKKTLRMLK